MEEPLISVIVPVYKVENYIERCVDSIVNQTYHNLEIILVDDGSPDQCGMICDRYAAKDPRIRVVHKRNGGLSSARNAGLEVATGDYIGFVDSDDFIDNKMYENLLLAICADNAIGIASCMIRRVLNGDISDYKKEWIIEEQRIISPQDFSRKLLSTEYNFTVWSKLYRRSLIADVRFEEGKINEDVLFIFALSDNVERLGLKMVEIPYVGYYYLMRDDSISNTTMNFLEPSIIENYCFMANKVANKDPLLAKELQKYADLVLLNFYCKVVRCKRKEMIADLLPKVRSIKLNHIDILSQKVKLFMIKFCPSISQMLIK